RRWLQPTPGKSRLMIYSRGVASGWVPPARATGARRSTGQRCRATSQLGLSTFYNLSDGTARTSSRGLGRAKRGLIGRDADMSLHLHCPYCGELLAEDQLVVTTSAREGTRQETYELACRC